MERLPDADRQARDQYRRGFSFDGLSDTVPRELQAGNPPVNEFAGTDRSTAPTSPLLLLALAGAAAWWLLRGK